MLDNKKKGNEITILNKENQISDKVTSDSFQK